MIQLEYTDEIVASGLTADQAVVYETLLKTGECQASALVKAIPTKYFLSRPLVYKILEDIIILNLAEKHSPEGKVATFLPKHPIALTNLIDEQKERVERTKKKFLETSGRLASLFNLTAGKPGVQFFEGKEGIWEVLMDSLTATEEILTYADLEAIAKYIPDLNAEYSTIREDRNIKKRGLVVDSPEARKFLTSYNGEVTHTKLISASSGFVPFQTVVQIYNQKISYITLTEQYLVGIIISDPHIYNTQKYLFESMWNCSGGEEV